MSDTDDFDFTKPSPPPGAAPAPSAGTPAPPVAAPFKAATSRFYDPAVAARVFKAAGKEEQCAANQVLFAEDDPSQKSGFLRSGSRMYFIAAGEVEVDLPGKKVQLGEGAFFGEMALLGNNLRSANITTTRLSKLLVLDLVDFRLLMARHPDLAQTIDAEAKRRALENK